jgi:hypothetical protein
VCARQRTEIRPVCPSVCSAVTITLLRKRSSGRHRRQTVLDCYSIVFYVQRGSNPTRMELRRLGLELRLLLVYRKTATIGAAAVPYVVCALDGQDRECVLFALKPFLFGYPPSVKIFYFFRALPETTDTAHDLSSQISACPKCLFVRNTAWRTGSGICLPDRRQTSLSLSLMIRTDFEYHTKCTLSYPSIQTDPKRVRYSRLVYYLLLLKRKLAIRSAGSPAGVIYSLNKKLSMRMDPCDRPDSGVRK